MIYQQTNQRSANNASELPNKEHTGQNPSPSITLREANGSHGNPPCANPITIYDNIVDDDCCANLLDLHNECISDVQLMNTRSKNLIDSLDESSNLKSPVYNMSTRSDDAEMHNSTDVLGAAADFEQYLGKYRLNADDLKIIQQCVKTASSTPAEERENCLKTIEMTNQHYPPRSILLIFEACLQTQARIIEMCEQAIRSAIQQQQPISNIFSSMSHAFDVLETATSVRK
jgi:hypothetical protein